MALEETNPTVNRGQRTVSERLEATLVPGVLLLMASGLWYLATLCATTALLQRSATAQRFFIEVLAAFGWSGTTILLMIGGGMVVASLVEGLLWPRSSLGKVLERWPGKLLMVMVTLLWVFIASVDVVIVTWGGELWVQGLLLTLPVTKGIASEQWAIQVVAILTGGLLGLLPEWLAVWALPRLFQAWFR